MEGGIPSGLNRCRDLIKNVFELKKPSLASSRISLVEFASFFSELIINAEVYVMTAEAITIKLSQSVLSCSSLKCVKI